MKKIALILLLAVFSMTAFSQSISLLYNGEPVSDTLNVYPRFADDDNTFGIIVHNNSANTLHVTVAKEVISEVEGAYNTFCLGSCYDPSTMVSPATIELAPGESSTEATFHTVYNPMGNYGVTTVKYSFYDEQLNETPAYLVVNYIFEDPDGIANHTVNAKTFNAYPNPATSQVTVQFDMANRTAGDNAQIVLTNLVGKKVCAIPVSGSNGKTNIDLSNLVAGIYFYSLEVNGKIISTKKLIVK